MPTGRQGSIHLFRFSGIDVFLHWSWFLVAAYEIQTRKGSYSSVTWNVLEYLALFLIVLTHEFGHSLACRQVGGRADRIVLWPLGGVAYVDPPPRPGATLSNIAAGPLVNVVLIPVLGIALIASRSSGMMGSSRDLYAFWTRSSGLMSACWRSTSFRSILWMAVRFSDPFSGL
jgi:Zn-dependent protease